MYFCRFDDKDYVGHRVILGTHTCELIKIIFFTFPSNLVLDVKSCAVTLIVDVGCSSDEQNHLVIAGVKLPNDERCFRADRYDDERNGKDQINTF